jgi:hypothetical protein
MTASVEPLAWDSNFFGIPIGRVTLDGATPESLASIDDEARELGIECLYGTLEASAETTAYLAQCFGYRLVEVSQLFDRPAGPFEPRPTKSTVRRGTLDDIEQLDGAFTVLAPWSRYGADPRFGLDAARRMHRAWVERAVREPENRLCGVAEDETGIVGVATYVRAPAPRVDFMGVTKPGTGASQALMGMLMEWAGDSPTQAGPCAARNIAVIRYVEGCGFKLSQVQYLYHRWLDEDAEPKR